MSVVDDEDTNDLPWEIDLTGGGEQMVSVRDLQKALTDAGYDPGAIDGEMGPKTMEAWTSMMKNARRARRALVRNQAYFLDREDD